ncbi:hypothetical protein C0J52_28221 [Blattella germanica]|nr:hypothetical protein C0J52_28221 [Blattella germanica]
MAHHYTREELAEIHLVYGEARETDINATEDDVLDIESFVVVNYDYSQGNKLLTRQFVGLVTDIHAKDVDVKFLRPFENSKCIFVFPNVDDEDTVSKNQITKILRKPKEEKGKFIFENNMIWL